ncbi:hypothetical protein ACF09J_30065 [Streptomyces sp. NPDC014889]
MPAVALLGEHLTPATLLGTALMQLALAEAHGGRTPAEEPAPA